MLGEMLEGVDPRGFATEEPRRPRPTAWSPPGSSSRPRSAGDAAWCGSGTEDGEDRAWTLLTTLYELTGHEEPRGTHRPMGAEHGATKSRTTWKERRQAETESLGSTTQPYVLVVGGGQGGIALGARLRQLGVPSLVIDKHPRPGDQWRGRYKSLCLHDPVWYDHLPYLKFPDNWPVFAPKDKIGDWLESYTTIMEVPYWSSTTATSATWSEDAGEWTVEVEREGKPLTLRPTHLVFATGMSGKANVPADPGQRTSSAATCTTPRPTPARTRTPGRRRSSSAATTPPSTSAARCGRTTSTSRWCSAPRPTSSRATA